ncbi:MAG: GNAT family N-acetyltransferase [Methanosarcinales archaeon]|nr:GNAT family N-acetyltransferase [Methanosarcinales archaeon]
MQKMIIKRATIDDAQETLILQKLAYQSEAEIYNDYNISPLIQTLEEMKDEFKDKYFLKAVVNGKIIGSVRAFVKEETCYIGRVIVHPDFQNQGTGTKLMDKIESLFSDVKRFELFTGHKSKPNIYLYQKVGYRIFKTEKITENLELVYLEKTLAITPNSR